MLLLEPPPEVHATPPEHQEGNTAPQTTIRQDPRPHAPHQARSQNGAQGRIETTEDVQTNSKEYRRLHLERFAAAIDAAAGKESGAKTSTIIQLMRFEEDRLIHLKCQSDMGKRRGPGISELMVPSDPNEEPSNNTTEWTIEGDK
jgi:hypothetical protein